MLFCLLLPVLIGSVGLAIDYAMLVQVRSTVQGHADAAVLSAAALATSREDEKIAHARSFFESAVEQEGFRNEIRSVDFSRVGQDTMRGSIEMLVPMSFSSLFGLESAKLHIVSEAVETVSARVLDVAMCIDATGSMQPTIDAVKANALNFQTRLNATLDTRGLKRFDAVRVRPIFFRDFGGNYRYNESDGWLVDKSPLGWIARAAGDPRNNGDDVPLRAAPGFYNLVNSSLDFRNFVNPELESGGGDDPESGLVCLNEALNSPWLRAGDSVLTTSGSLPAQSVISVIVIWTDQDTQLPDHPRSLANPNYPAAAVMPRSYAGLTAKWESATQIPQQNKLLVMFHPNGAPRTAWDPVMAWERFFMGGTLTAGNGQMIDRIVDGLATLPQPPVEVRLTN